MKVCHSWICEVLGWTGSDLVKGLAFFYCYYCIVFIVKGNLHKPKPIWITSGGGGFLRPCVNFTVCWNLRPRFCRHFEKIAVKLRQQKNCGVNIKKILSLKRARNFHCTKVIPQEIPKRCWTFWWYLRGTLRIFFIDLWRCIYLSCPPKKTKVFKEKKHLQIAEIANFTEFLRNFAELCGQQKIYPVITGRKKVL